MLITRTFAGSKPATPPAGPKPVVQLRRKPVLDVLSNFGLLLIGAPKSGKTSTCLCFEQPIAVLDCDNNFAGPLTQALKNNPEFDCFTVDPNFYYDENDTKLGPRPLHERWDACAEFMKLAIKNPEVRTIVIDSLSTLSDYLIAKIVYVARGEKHAMLKIGDMDLMARAHWQPFKNYLTQLVVSGRSAGKTFIMTCHEQSMTNDDGNVVCYRPMLPSSLRDNLAGFFSDVWRCETKVKADKPQYYVRVAPKNLHQIGNSLGIKETVIDVTNKTQKEVWSILAPYFGK